MTQFVEVKTAELVCPALDWAVAKCSGMTLFTMGEDWPGNYNVTIMAGDKPVLIFDLVGRMWREHQGITVPWSPSTDWAQGGPLLDSMVIGVIHNSRIRPHPFDKGYQAMASHFIGPSEGHTILIAACRAIVAAKMGDVVKVPVELAGVAK